MLNQIMEKCDTWDDVGLIVFQYYDPILAVDIGKYKKGEQVKLIVVNFEEGKLSIIDKEDVISNYVIKIDVEEDRNDVKIIGSCSPG